MAGSTLPWTILQTGQALFEKTFPPLADDLAWQIEMLTDFFILETFGGQKNSLGSNHLIIR
jgi:hypothetical protein